MASSASKLLASAGSAATHCIARRRLAGTLRGRGNVGGLHRSEPASCSEERRQTKRSTELELDGNDEPRDEGELAAYVVAASERHRVKVAKVLEIKLAERDEKRAWYAAEEAELRGPLSQPSLRLGAWKARSEGRVSFPRTRRRSR